MCIGPEAPKQMTVIKGHFQGGGRGHIEQGESQGAQGQMTAFFCPEWCKPINSTQATLFKNQILKGS